MSDIFVGVAVDIIAAVKAVANEAAERVRASRNLGGLSGLLCSANVTRDQPVTVNVPRCAVAGVEGSLRWPKRSHV